jgi:hypothetical protein
VPVVIGFGCVLVKFKSFFHVDRLYADWTTSILNLRRIDQARATQTEQLLRFIDVAHEG